MRDDPDAVTSTVTGRLADARTQVIVTTGGTGITSRDGTFEAIDRLFDKRLTGFGELFRMLSYEQIGPAAMMSRAIAGTAQGKAIFVAPRIARRGPPGDDEADPPRARSCRSAIEPMMRAAGSAQLAA